MADKQFEKMEELAGRVARYVENQNDLFRDSSKGAATTWVSMAFNAVADGWGGMKGLARELNVPWGGSGYRPILGRCVEELKKRNSVAVTDLEKAVNDFEVIVSKWESAGAASFSAKLNASREP